MSVLYNSAPLYHLCMRLIYGPALYERYEVIAREIPQGASVLDVCCGDCRLYTGHLKNKTDKYLGVDQSLGFKKNAERQNIPFKTIDAQSSDFPEADYVVMMGSLYQFIPEEEMVLKRLLKAARKKLIICEPVRNLANSKNPIFRMMAKVMTYPKTERFDAVRLEKLFKKYDVTKVSFVCNGREMIGFFHTGGA